jgi:Predicted membrane-associated Zn-dependent proteases 1
MEDTPAAEINLEEGDRIRSIDGTEVDSWSHMTQLIQEGEGNPQELMIESGEESRTATLEPTVESTELPDGTVQERLIIGVGRDFEDGVIAPYGGESKKLCPACHSSLNSSSI